MCSSPRAVFFGSGVKERTYGDRHGQGSNGGSEDRGHAEEKGHLRCATVQLGHGINRDGVDHRRQHSQKDRIQGRCIVASASTCQHP